MDQSSLQTHRGLLKGGVGGAGQGLRGGRTWPAMYFRYIGPVCWTRYTLNLVMKPYAALRTMAEEIQKWLERHR